MASELLKRQALINKLKEPDIENINFGLADSALDYSIESIEEDILPKAKPIELFEERERVRTERLSDTLNKIGGGLMDESVDFIKREEFAEGSVAMEALKKYINSLPEGTLVTKDLIEKFYKDNNLKGSKDFRHILNKVRGSKDIKSGIKFEASKKTITRRREFDDLGVKLKKVNPEEPFQVIGKKDDITGITDKRFQREFKLNKNGQNFVDNFNALIDAYDGSFKFTPDRLTIAVKAAGGDPKYRNQLKAKIGRPKGPILGKLKFAKGNPEKIKNYIKNVILNPETKWQELEGGSLNKHLAIKFNASNRYIDKVLSTVESPDPEIPKLIQENKRLFNFLNSNQFRKKFGTKKSRIKTIGDIQEFAEMRPKGLASYSARSKNPGMFIFESAFRNFTQAMNAQDAGKDVIPEVKFIGDPRVQNPSEWKFVYKNKTFGFNNVEGSLTDREMSKNALPESARTINDLGTTTEAGKLKYGKIFPEVYAIFEDKAKYDSTTYKGKQLDWYRRNIKADATGDEWRRKMPSVEIDHFEGVGKKPFTKLRLLDRDVNSSAGNLYRSYQTGNITKKEYETGLKALGFDEEYKGVDNFISDRIKEVETDTVKIPKVQEAFEAIENKSGQKKLTAFQELASRTGSGVDPSLLMKAGFEEFVKPAGKFAGQIARGTGTAADLLISAGPGAKGLGLGFLLEADPIITGMTEGKDFGQTARDTFIGSAIDAIPGVNLGSLNEDLIKLADTEEERVAVQNLIDYQKDYARFTKDLGAFKSYLNLDQVSLEELGFTASDLVNMENQLAKRFEDIQTRAPEVYNPEAFSLVRELAKKEAEKRKANLEGIQGLIFGDRMIKDPDFIDNQIQQILAASTGVQGATDSYTDKYRFFDPPEPTLEQINEIYEMGGITGAAEGGRIGFADGPIDPKRRLFLKIMGGIASLPIFSKFLGKSEVAKPVVKLAGTTTKMPEWFPDFVNKMMFTTGGKKIDADVMEYTTPKLPGVKMLRNDNGEIIVEGKNAYGEPYEIIYRPPGYELVDETTGKAVKTPGEFKASDTQFRRTGPEMDDFDVDFETVEDVDDILGGNATKLEGFAKGTEKTKYTKGQKAIDEAEALGERADEYVPYKDMDPTDFYED